MPSNHRLKPEELRWRCDPDSLGFETTAELGQLQEPIGQERAMAALDFGVRIPSDGYNVFVLGPVGTGRTTMARGVLSEHAKGQPPPGDWCYVHNFSDPRKPRAVQLGPGIGREFKQDVDGLIEDLEQQVTAAFESEEYTEQRDELLKDFRQAQATELEAFEKKAGEAGFGLGRGPSGLVVVPAVDGEVMTPQQYGELPEEKRKELDKRREELQEELAELIRRGQRKEKAARESVKELDRQVVRCATEHLIDELCQKYCKNEKVRQHLEQMKQDVVDNVAAFRDSDQQPPIPLAALMGTSRTPLKRYEVNVLVSHEDDEQGAPVVYEVNPTIDNLTGQIEHQTQMGALITDFSMIKPGALHQANGGYLLAEAEAVLRRPFAWEALKRCLKNNEIRIESLQDQLRWISTVSLEPEPIPLQVKVVLIGTPLLYHLLYTYDEDFRKLFKVKADFSTFINRRDDVVEQYAQFVAERCKSEGLPHFSAPAVAKVVEHAARMAGDREKLTTRFVDVCNLIREAGYWARQNSESTDLVKPEDIQYAIDQQVWRSNRIEEVLLQMIEEGTLLVDTDGEQVGQVNGLSLLPVGDYVIGRASRITCRTFLGRAGVVQIDREAKLTGPIHDKGVMILSGFLGQRFATGFPLSFAASIVFEQSYEGVEGDSAASAELFAMLSSLADLPIKQGIAVTGSVNQHGLIQPVGGVTRKVEGFFDTCKIEGLTGNQGVIIPQGNVRNLMLRDDVVEAVEEGKFHVWAIGSADEGIEILTGVPAGEPDEEGSYPPETVNARVQAQLAEYAELSKKFARPTEEEEERCEHQ